MESNRDFSDLNLKTNDYQSIVIVDDMPDNLRLLSGILKEKGYKVRPATNGPRALAAIQKEPPELILLDIMMPGMDGYEVCRELKSEDHLKDIPVIFLSALNQVFDKVKAFKAGGVDYITKPFQIEEVLARVHTHLELRAMQKKLQEQNKELKEAAQLKEDVDLIMRHDLKGPVSSIISLPSLIMQDPSLDPDHIESLRIIEDSGLRMLRMINLSLVLFKVERGTYEVKHESVDLNEILTKVKTECRELAKAKKVEIIIHTPGQNDIKNPVFISGEELLCHTVFSNLIQNAIEASPKNKTITVSIEKKELIQIRIQNYGAVPESVREIFFEKYATYGKTGGTGIGTYSARLIVQAHGGSIRLESPAFDQTEVIVCLKPVLPDLPSASSKEIEEQRVDFLTNDRWLTERLPNLNSKIEVLIADDDFHNRSVIAKFINHPAIHIDTAINGKEAVSAARRKNYHVIFMDMEMPVMGGIEATQMIRQFEKQQWKIKTPVIALSAHDSPKVKQESVEKGFSGYLMKPVNKEILFSVIRQCVDSLEKPDKTHPDFSTIDSSKSWQRQEDRVSYTVEVDQDLEDLIPEFLKEKKYTLGQLELALKENNYKKIAKLAHGLKGAWALYGFHHLADMSKEIESSALKENSEEIKRMIKGCKDFFYQMEIRYVDLV